jgi:prepilin-type N-terminal cleavage/methylation domain-containing protein
MTNTTIRGSRRGFTLIELIVGVVIFAIIGALMTQLITTQGRYYDRQGMSNSARNVSRASMNRVISDFRMIEASGGVVAASPTSLTLRIPYAIGIECGDSSTTTHVTILPVDSTTFANAVFYGYAWRSASTGIYTYVEVGALQHAAGPTVCNGVLVTTVPGGAVRWVSPNLPVAAGLGTPVFLYSKIRYEFKASGFIPGKTGLYRTEIAPGGAETTEELVAPFANTAGWKFFTLNGGSVAQAAAPADLSTLRGLELHFDGTSVSNAVTKSAPETALFTTSVFFKNRTN